MKNIVKKLNIVDIIIIVGILIALLIGIATSKHFRQTADKQIEATSSITFEVFLRGVTITGKERKYMRKYKERAEHERKHFAHQ